MQQNEIKLDMLHRLSIKELSDLILQCKTMINLKGGKQSTLKEGQVVTIDSPKLAGCEGIITKINKSKCKILIDGTTWNVPFDMIEVVGESKFGVK